jgi:hypothetical protein
VTGPTVREALSAFRRAQGLREDERVRKLWLMEAGDCILALPNFGWRRRAIDAHDVHHLLTGYPCTVAGELSIAAWEFGAGRYPHWGATLFCGPLVLAGFVWRPRETLAALRRGRRSRSLYGDDILPRLLDLPLDEARALVAPTYSSPESLTARLI